MPDKPLDFPGTYETFLASLPTSLKAISEADLQSLYQQAQENAAIAMPSKPSAMNWARSGRS